MKIFLICLAFLFGFGITGWVTGGLTAASLAFFFYPNPRFTKFTVALFEILGHIAKSDGVVDKEEIAVVEQIVQMLELDNDDRKKAIECFDRGKRMNDTELLASNLAEQVGEENDIKLLVITLLLEISDADNVISKEEKTIVEFRHVARKPIQSSTNISRRRFVVNQRQFIR